MTYHEPAPPPKSLLESLRRAHKWTRPEAAGRLKLTRAAVSFHLEPTPDQLWKWESYRIYPSPEYVQAFAELYGYDAGALLEDLHHGWLRRRHGQEAPGAVLHAPPDGRRGRARPRPPGGDDDRSREPPQEPAPGTPGEAAEPSGYGVGTGGMLDQLGRLQRDLARVLDQRTVDDATLEELDEAIYDLECGLETGQPVVRLLAQAAHRLSQTRAFLRDGQPVTPQRRLYRATGQLVAVIGRGLAGAGACFQASDWLRTAQRAAAEAGDDTLGAWIVAYRSRVVFINGDDHALLRLAQRGQELARRGGSPVTQVRLAGLAALAHARLGDLEGSSAARRQAEHWSAKSTTAERQLGPQCFTEAAQAELLAHAAALLEQPEAAELARDALASDSAPWAGWRPHAQLDLAAAAVTAGEPDRAAAIVGEVLQATPGDRRAAVARHLTEVLAQLTGHQDTAAVRELTERVAAWAPASLRGLLFPRRERP